MMTPRKSLLVMLPELGRHVPVRPSRIWGGLQAYLRIRERRATRNGAWRRGTLTEIKRITSGCDYGAPGEYEIATAFGDRLRVVIAVIAAPTKEASNG